MLRVIHPQYARSRISVLLYLNATGGAPTEDEEREHAIQRAEELRQYYERVFRLPAVTQVTQLMPHPPPAAAPVPVPKRAPNGYI